jgi:V/A-type H+-transporting ATPase subunit A
LNDEVTEGQIFATCPETSLIEHRFLIPLGISGKVVSIQKDGKYNIKDNLISVLDKHGKTHSLTMVQEWPIRQPRPVLDRKQIHMPLITGQRVIDTFFPIAKGGAAAIPGGFGAGKTMTQHQLAKWCDADIIVYVGCGERGNEMTQVLHEFKELLDPKSHKPLTDRTVLIANTSNMPVAAREASIYTGITIAEYYRDMGYHVALMADSTSRWAEALREISGRLEEMPAEEGFPAYLPSRIAQFYERAGYVDTLSGNEGSVTVIGAVSPQGADFSEPVTQNTKRFVRSFWALDKSLAYARHFPAINWNQSYSEYLDDLKRWYDVNVDRKFLTLRNEMMNILHEETQLMEIVKLIGSDVLPEDQKLSLEIARVIRVGYLQQNAFHPEDTFVPFEKQLKMLQLISYTKAQASRVVSTHRTVRAIVETGIFEDLIKIKYEIPNNNLDALDTYYEMIDLAMASIQ